MARDVDEKFYERADSLIHLANKQSEVVGKGRVSASFMYAQARYAAYVSACGFSTGAEMNAAKAETIEFFVQQFTSMLSEHLDEYISNFNGYMKLSVN